MNRLKKTICIILAMIPPLLLFLPKSKTGCFIALAVCIPVFVFFFRRQRMDRCGRSFEEAAIILLVSIAAGLAFYHRWRNTVRMSSAAGLFGSMPANQFCAILTAVLCLGFCFSLSLMLSYFPALRFSAERRRIFDLLFLFLLSAVTITVLSKCSPFYPFNDWVDPNTMFTVGKGMLRGKVPYRDLYEQKGPLLLALHALAALISFESFMGVWIIEIAACFFTLLFLYEILEPWLGRKALLVMPVLSLLIYCSIAFVAGDSAEEMSLPLLTYGLMVGIRAVNEQRLPTLKEGFFVGLTSGCIFWIKYTHVGFYAGWFLFFAIQALREKKSAALLRLLGRIICGVVISAALVFLYFAVHRSVGIFLECYFINNIRYYPQFGAAVGPFRHLINLQRGFMRFTEANPVLLVFFAAGLLWCFTHKSGRLGAYMLLTFLSGFILMFISGVSFPYYVFLFGSFSVLGILWFLDIPAFSRIGLPAALFVSFFLSIEACLLLSLNIYLLAYKTEDFPQFRVKEILSDSGIDSPSVLHYGLLDAGFNLPSGLVPGQRFWCSFNLLLPEMGELQDLYLEQGVTDFVITCHEPLYNADNYQLIGTFPGDFAANGNASLFFLYQRIENDVS